MNYQRKTPLRHYSQLLELRPEEINSCDITELNLACALGLPGSEDLEIDRCLKTLDEYANAVSQYSQQLYEEYDRRPYYFQSNRGFFLFLCMTTVLKHPSFLGIAYQPTAIGNLIFTDSRDDFLHGPLTRKLGTCASLPVLFVAIGRRLGYPVHLAIAKQHVLCQWVEPDGTHTNLEGSSPGGGEMYPDDYYHTHPFKMTLSDLESGRYLRPLTRGEEFGLFLETRGHCLADNGRFAEARKAYEHAHRVSDGWSPLRDHLWALEEIEREGRNERRIEATVRDVLGAKSE